VLLKARLLLPDPHRFTIEHVLQVARGTSDAEQFRYAVHTHATLVTYNIRDFQWLHRWWKTLHAWELLHVPHSGILAAPNSLRVNQFAVAILDFLAQQLSPLLANTMYLYRPSQQLWTREHW
jgi:hypothetical protein